MVPSNKYSSLIDVAIGIIFDETGRVLMTQRALQLHQGGLWEFPGGKIEAHETKANALKRELQEELSIDARVIQPLMVVEHHFSKELKTVRLHVYHVKSYSGTPQKRENQLDLQWIGLRTWDAVRYPVPAPNLSILDFLLCYNNA